MLACLSEGVCVWSKEAKKIGDWIGLDWIYFFPPVPFFAMGAVAVLAVVTFFTVEGVLVESSAALIKAATQSFGLANA